MSLRISVVLTLASLFAASVAFADPEAAPKRFSQLLEPAVHEGVLTQVQADQLEREWSNIKVGELPPNVAAEVSLTRLSSERGWLPPETASKLEARAEATLRDPDDTAVSWLNRLAALLPWLGGIALAGGALALIGSWLAKANHFVQAGAGALVTGALFYATEKAMAAHWATVSEVLAMGVAVAAAGTIIVLRDAISYKVSERVLAAVVAVAWGAEACRFDSTLVAGASAIAAGYWIQSQTALALLIGGRSKKGRALALIGAALLALGYFALFAAPKLNPTLTTLVRPYWIAALAALLSAVGVSWDWEEWLSPSRLWTVLLGIACIGWGVWVGEGLFIAAGELALVAWAYVMLLSIAKRLGWSAKVFLTGLLTLGIASGLDRYWERVVSLITLRSF